MEATVVASNVQHNVAGMPVFPTVDLKQLAPAAVLELSLWSSARARLTPQMYFLFLDNLMASIGTMAPAMPEVFVELRFDGAIRIA